MTDVFVSYARTDEAIAERIAEGLRAEGYHVWRDDCEGPREPLALHPPS